MRINRRSLLLTGAGAAVSLSPAGRALATVPRWSWDVAVIGAGVFGAWTAKKLQEAGQVVHLIDAWGPAHARASSGGESRMTRAGYGADEIYTRMAWESLPEWRNLSERAGLPILHETGVLFFAPEIDAYFEQSIAVHRRLNFPIEVLDGAMLRRRFPMIDFTGIEAGLFEPRFGALMARRAVQTLVAEFVRAGGTYSQAKILPPVRSSGPLSAIPSDGRGPFFAERYVFACGPWLGKLFPELLGTRIFPTRQEVFFFAPEAGDTRFLPGRLPGWADFNGGDIYYGFPDLEGRGFKIAHDAHGPAMDPDSGDRMPSAQALADVRAFMARRFPALAARPLNEARVCQYENSSNGDFLIDRHPAHENVVLVGAGSGHGFKHGPAVGRYAADLLLGRLAMPEPRFSLASKQERANRAVH